MAGDKSITTFVVHRNNPKPVKYFLDLGKRWVPSAMRFGFFSGAMFLYFTDWKIFMDKLPFYNNRFEEKERII